MSIVLLSFYYDEQLYSQNKSITDIIISTFFFFFFFLPEVDTIPQEVLLFIIIIFFKYFTRGTYDPSGDIIVIIEYYCLEDQASSSIAEGKVPRKATRLNLWMAIDRR